MHTKTSRFTGQFSAYNFKILVNPVSCRLRNIVKDNIYITNDNDELDLIIYYCNPKTAQLVMNNNTKKRNKLNSTNVIYQYNYPNEDCMLQNINYIGSTTTTLSRRLTMHLNNGAINDHTLSVHQSSLHVTGQHR